MAVKVIVPNKSYNAKFDGVVFQNGVGIFEDVAKAEKIASILGYKVEPIEAVVEKKTPAKVAPKKAPVKKAPVKKVADK